MAHRILATCFSYGHYVTSAPAIFGAKGYEVINLSCDEVVPVPEDELIRALPGVEGIIFSIDPLSARVLDAADSLKVVAKLGVGYDSVDLDAANRNRIYVANVPGVLEDSVADFTFGLILALARKIPYADRLVKSGGWRGILSTDVFGKCLGIIGMGRIGCEVARRALGFKMKVVYSDIGPVDNEFVRENGFEYLPLEKLLAVADYVSIHCNLSDATRNLLNRERLELMRPSAFLINTARGPIVEEDALIAMVREGRIAGAALDVYASEPPDASHFHDLDNLITTTHSASFTHETLNKMGAGAAEAIVDVLEGRPPRSWVNQDFTKNW